MFSGKKTRSSSAAEPNPATGFLFDSSIEEMGAPRKGRHWPEISLEIFSQHVILYSLCPWKHSACFQTQEEAPAELSSTICVALRHVAMVEKTQGSAGRWQTAWWEQKTMLSWFLVVKGVQHWCRDFGLSVCSCSYWKRSVPFAFKVRMQEGNAGNLSPDQEPGCQVLIPGLTIVLLKAFGKPPKLSASLPKSVKQEEFEHAFSMLIF